MREKILKLQKYTSTATHGEQTNLEVDKKIPKLRKYTSTSTPATPEDRIVYGMGNPGHWNVIVLYIM